MYQGTNDLGKRIAAVRRERGMTQDELASKMNITPQAVSKWERGTGLPDISMLSLLSSALGITVGELFGESALSATTPSLADHYDGLPLVARHGALGCYSDKRVKQSSETGVVFEDGSCVDYATRAVTNRGKGEIRLAESEAVEHAAYDEGKTVYDAEFATFLGLDITNNFACSIQIVASHDGINRIHAEGSARFISLIEAAVVSNTLRLHIKNPTGNGGHERDNRMTVEVAFSRGEQLRATINGSGSLSTALAFENGELTVNGSGDIRIGDVGALCVKVNGSGDVHLGNVTGAANLTVNGSGDIEAQRLGKPLCIGINGSGDVKAKEAADTSIRIAGAGDVAIGRISERLSVHVSGCGDLRCSGEVEQLDVVISGGGELKCGELSARVADIVLSGSAQVTLGRIIDHSTERIAKSAKLTVAKRG